MKDGRHQLRGNGRLPKTVVFGGLAIVLMIVLGVGLVTQVRETDSGDSLDSARPADLLVVLDNVGRREAALRGEISDLEGTLSTLRNSDGSSNAALDEARQRLESLSIQVGTVAAVGPGIVVTVNDPRLGVGSEVLVDALQELRAAGAEAIEIAGMGAPPIRIGIDSWIAGRAGNIIIDGSEVTAPFVFTAIGDSSTLAAALDIPGGVVDTVARSGGQCDISQSEQVNVSALREARPRQYSQPGN